MPVHGPEPDSEPATRAAPQGSDEVPAGPAARETAVVVATAGPPRPTLTPEDVGAVMYGDDLVWPMHIGGAGAQQERWGRFRDPGMLGRPANPPLNVRPIWPPPFQPTVRDLRRSASSWVVNCQLCISFLQ